MHMLRRTSVITIVLLFLGTVFSYALVAHAQPGAYQQRNAVTPATVKVYFPKRSDPFHLYSVTRFVTPPVTATYTVQLLIAGPTLGEQSAYNVFSQVNELLNGASNCQDRDFTITLNHRGSKPQTGTATLKFCRHVIGIGDLTDGFIANQIATTMKQFSTIKNVAVLTDTGHCLGDLSGMDNCLK